MASFVEEAGMVATNDWRMVLFVTMVCVEVWLYETKFTSVPALDPIEIAYSPA